MTIAVYTGNKLNDADEPDWSGLVTALTKHQPQQAFLFLSAKSDTALESNSNIIFPKAASSILLNVITLHYWLKKQLKSHRADILLTTGWLLKSPANLVQIFLLGNKTISQQLIKRKKPSDRFVTTIKVASSIMVPSEFAKKLLIKAVASAGEKTTVCLPAPESCYEPLSNDAKEAVKQRFSMEKEYFYYCGSISTNKTIILLLKAFSLFKKRQHSNMKLVLAGPLQSSKEGFMQKLSSYKFRNDVIVLPEQEPTENALLIGAAYSCINPAAEPGFCMFQLQAQQTATPFICCSAESEPASASVLYCTATEEAVSDKMKWLYKDENMRSVIVEQATVNRMSASTAELAAKLWTTISQSVTKC